MKRYLLISLCFLAYHGQAADWPQWRYDASRSANSPEQLDDKLELIWTRTYSKRVQTWDDPLNNDLMQYDRIFEPIVVGDLMILSFNDRDKVVALNTQTGKEVWQFFTEGPVRLPPSADKGKLFVCSDDGYLYCLDMANGKEIWKFRGGPSALKGIGNKRLISSWPARGGPVVRDGNVYFTASIWPMMGTFIYSLDAATGKINWINDGTSSTYTVQPHTTLSFAGIGPQGALLASKDILLVPGGRSIPAAFDRHTGKFLYFPIAYSGKAVGGSFISGNDSHFYVHTRLRGVVRYDLLKGRKQGFHCNEPVIGNNVIYSWRQKVVKNKPTVYDIFASVIKQKDKKPVDETVWSLPTKGALGDMIKASNHLYAGGQDHIVAVRLPKADKAASISWTIAVKGSVQRLLAANGKLFAVTLDGSFHAFGKKAETAFILKEAVTALPKTPEQLIKLMAVTEVLKEAAAYDGYGLYFGHDESIIDAMVKLTKLRLDVVSADKKKVDELRLRYDRAGLYGNRIVIHHGSIASFQAPAYMANFTIVDKLQIKDLPQLYKSVRPYGGSIWMTSPTLRIAEIKAIKLSKAEVRVVPDGLLITRKGALDGAADWTHQYGNIANTVKSDDKLVKLPLGVLWFGGSSNLDVLPRHGHGPPEQVLGGYLVIEGHNKLSVRDVYTGRVVWMKTFKKMGMKGIFWDKTYKDTPLSPAYNQVHIPGANVRGSNYVVTAEGIYLVLGTNCVLLDLRTGKTLKTISMPKAGDKDVSWGYLGIYKDLLIGGYGFADYSKSRGEDKSKFGTYRRTTEYGASKGIVVFNRHSGKELWRATAKHSFIHNGLIAGNDFIYCLDKLPRSIVYILKSKKKVDPATFRIVAYNAKTGKVIWQENKDVFGTWLSYSKKHGVLVQAGASGSDRGRYEVNKGVIAYNAKDGKVLWHNPDRKYTGPLVLHNDFLLTTSNSYQISAGAFHILTGKPYTITNPVTGAKEAMIFRRNHGCNTAIASEYLLTFRSGAAGFYDLEGNSGVGNFGGFKSGCTSNLVAANGVLNAPDYTRTCSCGYQNQTSLALIHMPELEVWTSSLLGKRSTVTTVNRVGINFGAPGDRLSKSGTLWLDYPSVGDHSPDIIIKVTAGEKMNTFRSHALRVQGEMPWVTASGIRNVESIDIELKLVTKQTKMDIQIFGERPATKAPAKKAAPRNFTIRLYFREPDKLKAGERVFSLSMQDKVLLKDFDIAKESAGATVVREFKGISISQNLAIKFTPDAKSKAKPLICGIELIEEK